MESRFIGSKSFNKMRRLFFLILIGLSSVAFSFHNTPLGIFYLYSVDGVIQIDITFEMSDFLNEQNVQRVAVNQAFLETYLDNHTSFVFNDKEASLAISIIELQTDHIRINGAFSGVMGPIEKIEIGNTCLIEVLDHSNLIQLDLNETFRDFGMHKGRTEIEILY